MTNEQMDRHMLKRITDCQESHPEKCTARELANFMMEPLDGGGVSRVIDKSLQRLKRRGLIKFRRGVCFTGTGARFGIVSCWEAVPRG